jgi:hypothetical protein
MVVDWQKVITATMRPKKNRRLRRLDKNRDGQKHIALVVVVSRIRCWDGHSFGEWMMTLYERACRSRKDFLFLITSSDAPPSIQEGE